MKVVFTCVPQAGHITPLMALAEAFARGGDDVVFVTGPDAEPVVTARGLGFRPAGPTFDGWYQALLGRTRGVPGDGLPPDRIEPYFLPRLFGEVGAVLMVDDLLAAGRDIEPDVLVFDPQAYAGPLVAASLGARSVQHAIGPLVDAEVLRLVADAVSPLWRQFGLDAPADAGVYRGETITICPPLLDPAATRLDRAMALRPAPPPHAAPNEDVRLPPGEEPLVYVTLGTFSNNPQMFREILGALEDEPVRLIVTVGRDVDPDQVGPVPPSARVERFLPQADLLPACAAVIHHAGAGTAFGVLAHGLPAVALPQSADNFTIAARLQAAGAAVTVMPEEMGGDALRRALHTALTDERHRAAAAVLAEQINAMPSPDAVAEALRQQRPAR